MRRGAKRALPEVEGGQHHGRGLAQQARQPPRFLGPEPASAAERHAARPLGPHAAHHPHTPVPPYLPPRRPPPRHPASAIHRRATPRSRAAGGARRAGAGREGRGAG